MRQFAVRHFIAAEPRPIEVTVVVPTLNESVNVEPLLERLAVALAGVEWEAIVVDDGSTDGTAELVTEIAQRDRRVRLVRRYGRRGLASAVIEGMLASTAPVVAVIDGDMQHDEAILPALYRAVAEGGCDLAVGTRYAEGGGIGDWCAGRARASRLATRLAAPLLKTPLSDPMSGFFAVRREAVLEALPRLSAIGYKILLDLVASSPRPLKVSEIPYGFRTRQGGESKLDSAVALEYAELLLDKLVGRFVPVKLILFCAVGGLGVFVHLALLAVAYSLFGAGFAAAQAIAVIGAMTFNFILNNELTYRNRRLRGGAWLKGLASFWFVCSLGAFANVGVGSLVHSSHYQWWVAGLAGAAIGSVWNYVASGWLTWSRR
jgi:dolichol-phosphate mannosyltransferase